MKLQSLIKINVVPDPEEFETCLIKLNCYRIDHGSENLNTS